MEGLIHGGKFACQNQLGQPYSWKEILHLRAISKPPGGVYIWRGDLTEVFLRYKFGGLIFGVVIHGGAYFWNFTVCFVLWITFCSEDP